MTIFTHGDICRHICGYLSFEDICMFRRCNKYLRTYISGTYFYNLKTTYLMSLRIWPSQIMGVTTDINYRRYLKKRGWRAICTNYRLQLICQYNVKLALYIMKTHREKIYGGSYSVLLRTKNRQLIDLSVQSSYPCQLGSLFREILWINDDELIQWFEDKHVGSQLAHLITESRPTHEYISPLGGYVEIMWKRYGSCYRSLFYPRTDCVLGTLLTNDVIFALDKEIMSRRVNKNTLSQHANYLAGIFISHGYVDDGDYFVKRD